jgi:hypothetical protein
LPSFIDKLRLRLHSPSTLVEIAESPTPDASLAGVCRRIESQGLFVIGAARTGTTILQNALNDSPDIFLFGEPAFHSDSGSADFAARYNAMHRSWGNQENKSSYCPPLFEADASWFAYLERMARTYRHAGSKIVINPWHAHEQARELFDFQSRHFYASHYLFTFRNPLDVLMSTRGLAELNGSRVSTMAEALAGYFAVVQLFFRALRNLPHVEVIFHEAVDPATFSRLERWLGVSLPHAADYYSGGKVRHYELAAIPPAQQPLVAEAIDLYDKLKRETLAGFELIQIEQNAGHFDPNHFTPLGRLSRDVSNFLRTIDAQA